MTAALYLHQEWNRKDQVKKEQAGSELDIWVNQSWEVGRGSGGQGWDEGGDLGWVGLWSAGPRAREGEERCVEAEPPVQASRGDASSLSRAGPSGARNPAWVACLQQYWPVSFVSECAPNFLLWDATCLLVRYQVLDLAGPGDSEPPGLGIPRSLRFRTYESWWAWEC